MKGAVTMRNAAILLGLLLAALTALPVPAGAEENYLHQSVAVTMLVADADQAADRLEAWAETQGGYVLHKSRERVSLRLPHPALPRLRGFLEELSEDILDFAPQATDLREQLARTQSSLASRKEILGRNLALLDQADTAGTLAIEREMLGLIQEVENLQAALARLTVDRAYARVEVALRYLQATLPEDIPSSFPWINQVSFYPFIEGHQGAGSAAPRITLRPPAGYAEAGAARDGSLRALSPEGLPFRVRSFQNAPAKDLEFWGEALKSHLAKEGYRANGEGRSFEAGNLRGSALEWVVPYGQESYVYLTALLVAGDRILLVEAGGPYKLYVEYRKSLEESLESIRPR
jgi:hypothetical protein